MKKIDKLRKMNVGEFASWLFYYANNPCNMCDAAKGNKLDVALTNCIEKISEWLNSDTDIPVNEYGFNKKGCFTVDELIKALKCMPLDAKVLFYESLPTSGYVPVNEVMIEGKDWHKEKIKKIVLSSND